MIAFEEVPKETRELSARGLLEYLEEHKYGNRYPDGYYLVPQKRILELIANLEERIDKLS